jgi:hypothetical protein
MNGVNSREVATESLPQSPHERIQACLKNLFVLPTTNIESAFELILGLVKEQSSKIDGLNRAHVEAVEGNAKICASVDGLLKENFVLSVDLRKLKEEHGHLLRSHASISCTLDKLRQDIEVRVVKRSARVPTRLMSLTCRSHSIADIQSSWRRPVRTGFCRGRKY